MPAAAGDPCSSAKATLTTSTVPTIVPPATRVRASTTSGPPRSAETFGAPSAAGWSTGGSVRFCGTNMRTPRVSSTTATRGPASGKSAVLSATASAGPTTKVSSSTTDSSAYAVWRRSEPRWTWVHRARTIAAMLGIVPASTALTKSVQTGAS